MPVAYACCSCVQVVAEVRDLPAVKTLSMTIWTSAVYREVRFPVTKLPATIPHSVRTWNLQVSSFFQDELSEFVEALSTDASLRPRTADAPLTLNLAMRRESKEKMEKKLQTALSYVYIRLPHITIVPCAGRR